MKCVPHIFSRKTQYTINSIGAARPIFIEKAISEVDKVTKVVTPILSFEKYNPYDNDDYRISDFSLENLIAVGKSLNPTSLIGDTATSIDNIETQLSNLE